MMTLRLILLAAAFLSTVANAQTCSGGTAGGMDATGNQCAVEDAADSVRPTAVRVEGRSAGVAHLVQQQQKNAGVATVATVVIVKRHVVVPIGAPGLVRSAKLDNGNEGACSGGADGGMDATGNQCPQAEGPAGIELARATRR